LDALEKKKGDGIAAAAKVGINPRR